MEGVVLGGEEPARGKKGTPTILARGSHHSAREFYKVTFSGGRKWGLRKGKRNALGVERGGAGEEQANFLFHHGQFGGGRIRPLTDLAVR